MRKPAIHWLRLFILLSGVVLCGCIMGGCAKSSGNHEADKNKPTLVTTNFPLYDFAREIAGEHMEVLLLLPPGMEGHAYEPTPQDIIRIQNCALFLYIGGNSDTWVARILSGMEGNKPEALSLMPYVEALDEEYTEGMQAGAQEHAQEEGQEYDEHIWTSPRNAIKMVAGIADALSSADPANAAAYSANAHAYTAKLEALDADFRALTQTAKLHTLVFGDRFPFLYFAKEYGLTYFAAFPGCAENTEPSAATVAFLIDKVHKESIPAVFHMEFSNQMLADTICEATGAKKLLLHSCHNVSKEELMGGVTYLGLMYRNADALKEALLCS